LRADDAVDKGTKTYEVVGVVAVEPSQYSTYPSNACFLMTVLYLAGQLLVKELPVIGVFFGYSM
jgi:hypothetical protein